MVRELPRRATRGVKREASPDPDESEPVRKKRGGPIRSSEGASRKDAPVVEASLPPTPEPVVEPLPLKITSDQPLPVVSRPQSNTLSKKDYQSIAESGILAMSLERSRHAWLHNCIFDRFWSKAHYKKKKDAESEGKGPGGFGLQKGSVKPPMTKVGDCKLTVDPHVFDVTLFIVKDTSQPPIQQSTPTQQTFVPYGGSKTTTPVFNPMTVETQSPNLTQTVPVSRPAPSHQANFGHPSTPIVKLEHFSKPLNTSSQTSGRSVVNGPSAITTTSSTTAYNTSTPTAPALTAPRNPAPSTVPSKASILATASKPDPVIAMLAERAQNSRELKEIMQIVATGHALAPQLSIFQSHITEITAIVERRNQEAAAAAAKAKLAMTAISAAPSPSQASSTPIVHTPKIWNGSQMPKPTGSSPSSFASAMPGSLQRPPSGISTPIHAQPQTPRYISQPAPVRKPSLAALHVLLEFNQNIVDRFLFPAHSILEFGPDYKSCLCSFLVLRTGPQSANPLRYPEEVPKKSSSSSNKKGAVKIEAAKAPIEYYQPMTVKFTCSDSNVLNYLAKVVRPQDEVRKYMEDIMRRGKRAEDIHLPLRLPRKNAVLGAEEVAVTA